MNRLNSYNLIHLFLVSIYILIIRFYLASALGIPGYNRIFLVAPFIFLLPITISNILKPKDFIKVIITNRVVLISILLPLVHLVLAFFAFKAPLSKFVIYGLPVAYFPIVCVFLSLLFEKVEYQPEFLSFFFVSIIWTCGLLICGEYLLQRWDLLPSLILQNYLVAKPVFNGLGTSVDSISSSRLGPLVLSSTSSALMVVSTTFLFSRVLELLSQREKDFQKIGFLGVTFIFGSVSVIQMDSITSVGAMVLSCLLAFMMFAKNSKNYKYFVSLGIITLTFLGIVFFNSRTYERVIKYATIEREMVSKSVPSLEGCSLLKSLWVKNFGVANGCDLGEVHLVKKALSSVGIIPMLPWFIWFLLPIYIFLKRRKWSEDLRCPEFLGIISLYLCSLHYSPVESWGINFIFFTLVVVFRHSTSKGKRYD